MRRSLVLLFVVALSSVLLQTPGFGAALAPLDGRPVVGQEGLNAALPVARWVSGKKAPAPSFTDALAALDPNKNYTVYCIDCSEYVIVEDNDATWKCPADDDPTLKDADCDNCVTAGWVRIGRRWVVNEKAGFMKFASSPLGLATFGGAGAAALAIGLAGGDDQPGTGGGGTTVNFTTANGTYQGSLPLQNPGGACATFTNPAVLRLTISNASSTGGFNYQLVHVAVNVTFNGSGTLTSRSGGGFNVTLNPAATGTLTQSGQGTLNTASTEASGTFPVTSATGTCTYGPGVLTRVQ